MYKVVVTKLPQEAEMSLALTMASYTNSMKRTICYSLNDTIQLLSNPDANDNSYVEVVAPNEPSQQETIDVLESLGIKWVSVSFDYILPIYVNHSQNDPKWRNVLLGDGSVPNKTIGNWGCLSVAYNNMAIFLGLCDDDPNEYNTRQVNTGAIQGIDVQPGALRTCFPESVGYEGWETGNILNRIIDKLDEGIPVPVRVDLDQSADYVQHWVLVIGYTPDGQLIIADPYPYPATIKYQNDTPYDIIYEALFYNLMPEEEPVEPPPSDKIDLTPFFTVSGKSLLYELQTVGAGQERCQLQQSTTNSDVFYITKNSLFEQLRVTDTHIQRGVDTSMNPNSYYVLETNDGLFVNWLKTHMSVGETFTSKPIVTHYNKSNCLPQAPHSTNDYLTLDAVLDTFDGLNGIVLGRTIKVSWRKTSDTSTTPIEVYYFTAGMGLTGWGETNSDRTARVSEIHYPGQRPDNVIDWMCIREDWRL